MKRLLLQFINILLLFMLFSCTASQLKYTKFLNDADKALADSLNISYSELAVLKQKPLFEFNEKQVDTYLRYLHLREPSLINRVKHLGKKNIGQPYEIYLLGEFPFEIYDRQPLYCLDRSDCVVFIEHTFAMALAHDWNSFFTLLQKIRYKDGHISLISRNHYANRDWNANNSWLVTDITDSLANGRSDTAKSVYNLQKFFMRWNLDTGIEKDSLEWTFIPAAYIDSVSNRLQTGDLVQIVRGVDENIWVGHFGMIVVENNEVYFLHSTPPRVTMLPLKNYLSAQMTAAKNRKQYNADLPEQNRRIEEYNSNLQNSFLRKYIFSPKRKLNPKAVFLGMKFLRLLENPLENLKTTSDAYHEE